MNPEQESMPRSGSDVPDAVVAPREGWSWR